MCKSANTANTKEKRIFRGMWRLRVAKDDTKKRPEKGQISELRESTRGNTSNREKTARDVSKGGKPLWRGEYAMACMRRTAVLVNKSPNDGLTKLEGTGICRGGSLVKREHINAI